MQRINTPMLADAPASSQSKLIEFQYGPLHGTRLPIAGEPETITIIHHGRRVEYWYIRNSDGAPFYCEADEWAENDADPYPHRKGGGQ